jgi:hypothetical protein
MAKRSKIHPNYKARDAKMGEAGYMMIRSTGNVCADFESCTNAERN